MPKARSTQKQKHAQFGSPGDICVTQNTYNAAGLLQSVTTPDDITLTFSCDDRSRLQTVTDNAGQANSFTYDDTGNITKTETRNSDGSLALLVESIFDSRNCLITTKSPTARRKHPSCR